MNFLSHNDRNMILVGSPLYFRGNDG